MENLPSGPDAAASWLSLRSLPTPSPLPIPASPIFANGTILEGTYRIVQCLGQGGMGEIYLAAHERLPGYFAIKALQAELAYHPEALVRFRREAEILAGVRHPNVVQVIDFNVSTGGGVPYLVLEFVDGRDLASEMRGGGILAPFEVMSIVRQVASALAAAHAVGVVHRDLKPENIVLVRAPGQAPVAKVIDFGISISGFGPRITADSRVMGTPEYMSPEQALGRREEIDARSDQFALAALAYTLLARRPPFHGDSSLATLSAIVHGEPEPLAPDVNWPAEEAEAVLRKGMARMREDRFSSVLEFTDALEAALARSGALDTAPVSGSWPPPPFVPLTTSPTPRSLLRTPVPASVSQSLALPVTSIRVNDNDDDDDDLVPARHYSPRAMAGLTAVVILVAVLWAARGNLPPETRRAMDSASTTARVEVQRVVTGVSDWVDNTKSHLKM
ncbi:MAG TPA: serine/threonine-protein kinase [Polyangia bacterium]|nr:serine/threonine-protein kinase [Polyangia bacterium]